MNRCRFDRLIRQIDQLVAGRVELGLQLVRQERQRDLLVLPGLEPRRKCRQWERGRLRQMDRPGQLVVGRRRLRELAELVPVELLRMNRQKPPTPESLAFVVAHPMGLLVRLGWQLPVDLENKVQNKNSQNHD